VGRTVKTRNASKISVEKPDKEIPLRRHKGRWNFNITVSIKEIRC
jgi:hypothetical protein